MATYVLTEHYPDTFEVRNHMIGRNAVDTLADIAPHWMRNDSAEFDQACVMLSIHGRAVDHATGYHYVFTRVNP